MGSTTDDFEEFARARTPQLYRTAWLLAGDRHHAEDLVQETLAKMYRSWWRMQRIENPAAYAQTVLARTFVSQRRKRSWNEQPTAAMPDGVHQSGDLELRLALRDALAELAPLDRAVLVLRFFEDRSVEQVALDLGKNAGAIRTRTSRALDRLRAVLGDDVHLIAL
ncbi:SigE family RNA polymerase sigma factor [Kribbella italica]|uniref:RNA polymerase sigma-70 factor (Sigma-E family) n=1 Tax=Kribbella italica TaxID=1540520 RepID=A0A7W9JFK1_9ACTN|nr:SigE family RNA polymerase sigma factor [Kribbella italica]MBB5841219.1 RNA polymerase sigma-70 factor (sigma-E family) [Kribbella italica]